jgi:hypothetical protein
MRISPGIMFLMYSLVGGFLHKKSTLPIIQRDELSPLGHTPKPDGAIEEFGGVWASRGIIRTIVWGIAQGALGVGAGLMH